MELVIEPFEFLEFNSFGALHTHNVLCSKVLSHVRLLEDDALCKVASKPMKGQYANLAFTMLG